MGKSFSKTACWIAAAVDCAGFGETFASTSRDYTSEISLLGISTLHM